MKDITSFEKRDSVKKNYDLIAEQYSNEFGNYIEDLDAYEEFEKVLVENAKILDLGAGSGRTYSYFNKKGYEYTGLDFSEEMVDEPYLNENGKKVLYMSYQTNEEIKKLLDSFSYTELYRKEKVETSGSAINRNDVTTAFVLVKKIK